MTPPNPLGLLLGGQVPSSLLGIRQLVESYPDLVIGIGLKYQASHERKKVDYLHTDSPRGEWQEDATKKVPRKNPGH